MCTDVFKNVPKVLYINCHELMDIRELDPRAESIHMLNNLQGLFT